VAVQVSSQMLYELATWGPMMLVRTVLEFSQAELVSRFHPCHLLMLCLDENRRVGYRWQHY
jgi:hypothetical protein